MKKLDTREDLLLKISNDKVLDERDLSEINFINLHAHSTYSLQDAVGKVEDHFVKTMDAGHCGCCITDHGSYASFFDLYQLKNNKVGSDKVQRRFDKYQKDEHPVVMGAELYIIDDRHMKGLREAALAFNKKDVLQIITKLQDNPQWSGLFFTKKEKLGLNTSKKKTTEKIGARLINTLEKLNEKELVSIVDEFNLMTLRCTTYKYNHITLMAKNAKGHSNLCHLTSIGSLPENFYSRPRIKLSDLIENKEGLIVTSGCFVGMIPQAINRGTGLEEEYIKLFKEEFDNDFYMEIHLTDVSFNWDKNLQQHVKTHEINPMIKVNDRLIELAHKYGLEKNIYITQDSHMPNKEDKEIQDIVIINDPGNTSNWHFKNIYYIQEIQEMYDAMRSMFPHYTNTQFINWCFNTLAVLEKCRNVEIDMSLKFITPDYNNHPVNNPYVVNPDFVKMKEDENEVDRYIKIDKLRKETISQLPILNASFEISKIFPDKLPEFIDINKSKNAHKKMMEVEEEIENIFKYTDYYTQKAKYFYKHEKDLQTLLRVSVTLGKIDFHDSEFRSRFFSDLDTIQFNGIIGLSDYFMVFEDFSRLVVFLDEFKGPGRGSAAGCMVSYAIDVTDIEPIKYSLLMERFLQPERVGVMDFAINGYPLIKGVFKGEDFIKQIEKLKIIKDCLKKSNNDNKYDDEMYYLERNLHVVDYIYKLKFQEKLSNLENTNNSKILFEIGLCQKPTRGITKSSPSMPDIDYDSSCRDSICEYLMKVHTVKHACYIGTYGSLKVRSAIKDVLRVRKVNGVVMSVDAVNRLTKELDKMKFSEKDMSKGELYMFTQTIEQNVEFGKFFEQNLEIKDDVENILGTYKNSGIHAAGEILFDKEITRYIPCTWDKKKNAYKTQLCKEEVEQLGFIKLDLLGITTGEDIRDCARLIKKRHGINYFSKWEEVLNNLPPEVGEGYVKSNTTSVFQMNTPVSMDLLRKVKIMKDPVRDIAGFTSALRPGPMSAGVHLDLVDTINGNRDETYLHESLRPFLKDTKGHLIYQEQVMQICIEIGGFTKFEADKIRKAMGKKKIKIIDKFGEQFLKYATEEKNISRDIAQEIWDNMAAFAEYGFNKSHAICYAAVSCICMYFKVKYPMEWMAACLGRASRKDSESDKKNYKRYYREWKSYLKNPDINKSGEEYEIVGSKIYMPIYASKAIKKQTAVDIMKLREFSSFDDFIYKLKARALCRKDLVEALIYSGACDSFSVDLKELKLRVETDLSGSMNDLDFVCGLAKSIHGIEFDVKTLQGDQALDLLGIINKGSEQDSIDKLMNSGIFDMKITKLQFRKYLIIRYYSVLTSIAIKKPLLEMMNELGENTYANRLSLMSTQNVDDMQSKEISKYNKWNGVNNKGQNLAVKSTLSKKEKEDAYLIEEELTTSHDKTILAKEIDYLNFTSFNFSRMYKEEVAKICSLKVNMTEPVKLSDVKVSAGKILKKIHLLRGRIKDIVSREHSCLIKAREDARVIISILAHIESVFGNWQLASFISDIEYHLESVPPIDRIYFLLAFESEMFITRKDHSLRRNTLKDFSIPKKSKEFLCKKHSYILDQVIKSKIDIREVNVNRFFNYSLTDLVNLLKLSTMIQNQSNNTLKINANRERQGAQWNQIKLGEEINQEDIQQRLRLSKPGNDKEILDILKNMGINGGLNQDLFLSELDHKRIDKDVLECSIYFIDEMERNIIKSPFYVFGSMFKPEKKDFMKEYSNKKGTTKVMNLLLSDSDEQIMVNIKEVDKIELYKSGKSLKFTECIKDFSPVVFPVVLNFNLSREDFYNLRLWNDLKNEITFVEDYL